MRESLVAANRNPASSRQRFDVVWQALPPVLSALAIPLPRLGDRRMADPNPMPDRQASEWPIAYAAKESAAPGV